MARTKKTPEVAIFWREGRAYGDFTAYEDIRGKWEALKEPGTTDWSAIASSERSSSE